MESSQNTRHTRGGQEVRQDSLGELQILRCVGCGTVTEIRRRTAYHPERYAIISELFHIEHKDCHRYHEPSHALAMLRINREFRRLGLA